MLTVFWKGKCPKCGSNRITQLYWGNVCNKCGYWEGVLEEVKKDITDQQKQKRRSNAEPNPKANRDGDSENL